MQNNGKLFKQKCFMMRLIMPHLADTYSKNMIAFLIKFHTFNSY